MRVRVLGPVAAGADDVTLVEPPGQVPAAVLAHLALAHGRVLTPDALAELVWDSQPDNVRNALQAAVSRLRRTYGEGLVETSHGGYRLGAAQVDAEEAAELLRLSRGGDVEAGARALALWQGLPLAGLASSASELARTSLEDLRTAVVVSHSDALVRRGRPRDAIALLQETAVSAPYDEAVQALLMRALAGAGRAGDALTAYDRFRRRLADDLGIDPSAEVASTFVAILDGVAAESVAPSVSEPRERTVVLTDIVGSARLWRERPDDVTAALLAHHALVSDAVARHAGALPPDQGEGDARMALFDDPVDAVEFLGALQRDLAGLDWPGGLRLHVRAAAARGRVVEADGNAYGAVVPLCARLRALAHGDQVLITGDVADAVEGRIAGQLRPLGRVGLRDIGEVDVVQLDDPAAPREFPPLRTTVRLPALTTPVVGRESEAHELVATVRAHRLVTLTGLGGCGKTTLAIDVAGRLADAFPDGVHFVDLSACTSAAAALDSIGTALVGSGSSLAIDALRALGPRSLLVLDNLEQVPDASALVGEALAQSGAHLLCTSRGPLGAHGEVVRPLGALSDRDATALLAARVSEQGVPVDGDALARLAEAVGGIPLALELAAGRLRVIDPRALADDLDHRLTLLSTARGVPERQRAVETLLADTWLSIDDDARLVLTALALVRSPVTAPSLADLAGIETVEVADALDELIGRGLVRTDHELGRQPSVSVLELVRRHAIGTAPPELLDRLRHARVEQVASAAERDRARTLQVARDDVLGSLALAAAEPSAYDDSVRLSLADAALALGRWSDVVGLLDGVGGTRADNLVGVALVRSADPGEVALGRARLRRAADHGDPDAAASLGGSLRDEDPDASYRWYLRALEIDPDDAYALGNVIEHELLSGRGDPIAQRREAIQRARTRRTAQCEAGDDLPWSAYDAARLGLWLRADDALTQVLSGAATSTSARQVETTLASFRRLASDDEDWLLATRILEVAQRRFALRPSSPLDVLVVAGASSTDAHDAVMAWLPSLAEAALGSVAEIVSGGTDRGVSALAAALADRIGVPSTGWLPGLLPDGVAASSGFAELRRTDGRGFTLREPLGYWDDLLVRGVDPAHVHVLGLGGGALTELELRLAQALGARVALGVVNGSVLALDQPARMLADDTTALRAWLLS